MTRITAFEMGSQAQDGEPEAGILEPLVERLQARFGEAPLAGVTALLFQHQLLDQAAQLAALRDLGLDLARTWWVDIPYTAHEEVRATAVRLGVPPDQMIRCDRPFGDIPAYRVLEPYAPYQLRRSLAIYRRLRREAPQHLLVLDDGAYFLAADACFERGFERVSIVEQTSRGYTKLAADASLRLAASRTHLVDVARCEAKNLLESPFIGSAVSRAIKQDLDRLHEAGRLRARPEQLSYLLLGYGSVGSQVAASLEAELGEPSIKVFEPDQRRSVPYPAWQRDTDEHFDVVIGSSGQRAFGVGDHVFLADQAVLISTSSGAMEFDLRGIVEHASASDHDQVRVVTNGLDPTDVHGDIRVEFPGRRVTILNGGFPVNFRRGTISVPSRYIRVSNAMMVCGAVQAVLSEHPGDRMLDADLAMEIVALQHEALGADWGRCGLPDHSAVQDAIRGARWTDPLAPFSPA